MGSATLVLAGHNRLRYLVVMDGGAAETVFIEADGGPSPDLLTDSLGGPIKNIMNVRTQGYGIITPPGLTTDAQARALLLSDNATALVGPGLRTCIVKIEQRSGTPAMFKVNAGRGPSDATAPGLAIIADSVAGGFAYITLLIDGLSGT